MEIVLAVVALGVAGLTLYSGFGLGTLLLPVFAFFYPLDVAVAATAVVHLLNNVLKLLLVGRHADARVLLRFVVPAIPAAFLGAWLLGALADRPALTTYALGGRTFEVTVVGLVVGGSIALFGALELTGWKKEHALPPAWIPVGGAASGFFGGLSGHQGALRSIVLLRAGLSQAAFIGTAATAAALVDLTRLAVYGRGSIGAWTAQASGHSLRPLLIAMGAAFLGSYLASRWIEKVSLPFLHRLIGVLLLLAGSALAAGLS